MREIFDWVQHNLFEISTALVGIWLSWKFRAHPTLVLTANGFRISRRHEDQVLTLRIRNTGQTRIEEDTYSQPVEIRFPSNIQSVAVSKIKHADIPVRYERRGVRTPDGEAIRALRVWATLEPDDWAEVSVRISPIPQDLSSIGLATAGFMTATASLKGNRRGFRYRGQKDWLQQLGILLAATGSALMVFLAVHACVENPPLGLTFPILWIVVIAISELATAKSFVDMNKPEAFTRAMELSSRLSQERRAPEPTEAEVRSSMVTGAVAISLAGGAARSLVAVAYIAALLLEDQVVSWTTMIAWAVAVSVCLALNQAGGQFFRGTSTPVGLRMLQPWVVLGGTVLVGLAAVGHVPPGVGLLALAALAVTRSLVNLLQKDPGVAPAGL